MQIFNWSPEYNTPTFSDIYPSYNDFSNDYNEIMNLMFPTETIITENSKQKLFYLLYSTYSNNPITHLDVNQWKFKLFGIIGQYAPMWERKLSIQKSLRNLTDAELIVGAKQIYNHAFNPSTAPSTSDIEELEYINDQNTAIHKKSKMEGYSILWSLLRADETKELLNKFQKCFSRFVANQRPIIYEEDE